MFFGSNLFNSQMNYDIVVVSDLFESDYAGGAEMTTEALLAESTKNILRLKSHEVNEQCIKQYKNIPWLICNYANLHPQNLKNIAENIRFGLIEYDYKYCKYRSTEKHIAAEGSCKCENENQGKLISEFMYTANCIWYMSEAQKEFYELKFPLLKKKNTYVCSSVFKKESLVEMSKLRLNEKSETWIVLGSDSWVKGKDEAIKHCESNNKKYEVVWGIEYSQLLDKLSKSKGLVYLPSGKDTCPRLTIEAKLLNCEIVLNENVQQYKEPWFCNTIEDCESYISARPQVFWSQFEKHLSKKTVSGYITVYNCESQKYPYTKCIKSLLKFCDEVVVVDGGSNDGTYEALIEFSKSENKLKLYKNVIDFTRKDFALSDGEQKAFARSKCTSELCWQMDSDEVLLEEDCKKAKLLIEDYPKNIYGISLPVVEYWGKNGKVRFDVTPWKWRVSLNHPRITHGIPGSSERTSNDGLKFAVGSDGCDVIDCVTKTPIPFAGFYTKEHDNLRMCALQPDEHSSYVKYSNWFKQIVSALPTIRHLSWYDIERKIYLYKNYWTKHWASISNQSVDDTSENNMFFDLPWSSVTDEMIRELAIRLEKESGGHIWHTKWNGRKTQALDFSDVIENEIKEISSI